MSPKKFSAYVIDNDMAARMRLKTAMSSVALFGTVKMLNTLNEGQSGLSNAGHIDVVFVANRFDQAEITKFVAAGKQTPGGRDSAYVLVLSTDDQDSNTVAKNVLIGADGFLLEPYSVDNLVDMTNLAAKVKAERSQEREQAAIRFLINDVIKHVDRMSFIKSAGYDVSRALKKLKDMCVVFEELSEQSKALYFNLVVDAFMNAPLPENPVKDYKGVSERVRKKMEAKIIAEMEAEVNGEDSKPSA